ncbi:MAG: NYN domain-containing protein [Deltaproteobacteria bacterium]|nr:NYN domain-containing protein [Deltaproteobacteria bacterium]
MNFHPTPLTTIRAVAFFDGQNLFHAAKEIFGYTFPNYDPQKLAQMICGSKGWQLTETRFYTGVPDMADDQFWNYFWTTKIAQMRRNKNVYVFSRPLRYRNRTILCPDGHEYKVLVGEEKGIDVRIAIDAIRLAHKNAYDVALIYSQDQDLSEVADEIRTIAQEQNRWIKIACAFPHNQTQKHTKRGINKTDWLPLDKLLYDVCLDPRDYRPKK